MVTLVDLETFIVIKTPLSMQDLGMVVVMLGTGGTGFIMIPGIEGGTGGGVVVMITGGCKEGRGRIGDDS